nr:hypothetical protein [Triaenophora shennongjiaensis]
MVTLPLTTSFLNFIVIEIHVLPRHNLQFAILLPSRQRFTYAERMIHSDRHESPTALPESMLYILKEVDPLLLSCTRRAPFLLGPQRQNVGLVPTVHHGRKDSLSWDH